MKNNSTWDDCIARYEMMKSYTAPDGFVHICAVHMIKLIECIQADVTFPELKKGISHEMLFLKLPVENSAAVAIAYYGTDYHISFNFLEAARVPFERAISTLKHYIEKLDSLNESGVINQLYSHSLANRNETWTQQKILDKYGLVPSEWMLSEIARDLKLQLMYARLDLEEYVKKHQPPNALIPAALERLKTLETLISVVEEIDIQRRSQDLLTQLDS